jgi:UDP-N-acetylmuramoyl-tripeptide--D-alanyl-D-alanine ligase
MKLIHKAKKALYIVVAKYFRFWANISLSRWRPRVIAITGSVGKTTMLHLVETQLAGDAHYSHFANSAFGVAFDIVGLRGVTSSKWRWLYLSIAVPVRALTFTHTEKFYVVEVDGERPREATLLAEWLKPEVTLWVSVGRSHAAYYDKLVANGAFTTVDDAIAHEFASLPRYTQKLVVIDGSSTLMQRYTTGLNATVTEVHQSSLRAYHVTPDTTTFETTSGAFTFHDPMPMENYLQLTMLEQLMMHLERPVNHDLSTFVAPVGRNHFLRGARGVKLIDSTYNAHLISMTSMINMLTEMPVDHKWVVLGDMVEQGDSETEEHTKLGELLATTDFERIVLVGRRVSAYTLPAIGGENDRVISFTKTQDALAYLKKHLSGDETVLFKGSQYLEWVVEKLLADPADASQLARQDKAARKRRASWGLT